jgi:peptide/nickel transport system permease protein
MRRYVVLRLAAAVALLISTSFVVFALLFLAPGDPAQIAIGGRHVSPATVAAIRRQYHLNDPFFVQYLSWLGRAVHGDFGQSLTYKTSVGTVVTGRILPTLELAGLAAIMVLIIGLPLGFVGALTRGKRPDTVTSFVTLVASSFSPYVSGVLLIWLFSVKLRAFPVFGLGGGFADRLDHLFLPACALSIGLLALLARVSRAALGDALGQEYVDTARSRGLPARVVLGKHAMRTAAIPVVTVAGIITGYMISGAVLVEYTFGLNGLGALLVSSIQLKDFAVVQAIVLIFTAAFIVINLSVDLLYGVIDPRVRHARVG